MINKLIIWSKQNMWLYKQSKFDSLQIEIQKKVFASEMCYSRESELELVSALSDVRSGK